MSEANNNRLVLLLIAGIPLTMILVATWLWYFVVQGDLDLIGKLGTANRGELVQPPRQIDEVAMYEGAAPAAYGELEPRWTLAIPWAAETCNEVCENTLYVTRQIHVAIGKDFKRLRRLYLSEQPIAQTALGVARLTDGRPLPSTFAEFLSVEHRRVTALRLGAGSFVELFPEWQSDNSTWYLIDPRGWIMMSYNSDIPYKDVISDLKFLLKNSSD